MSKANDEVKDERAAIERRVIIRATRETVFRFLCESEAFARWWGPGSQIEPRVGGRVSIVYPNGVRASGEVLALAAPHAITFTFGYEGDGKPLPPGGSIVEIRLHEHPLGTELELRHELPSRSLADTHVPGWRYQLAIFAKLAHELQHGEREAIVAAWFEAWNAREIEGRRDALARACTEGIEFYDAFACVRGRDELLAHLTALGQHMPGVELVCVGPLRYAQGVALADWAARKDGIEVMAGTNVFELAASGQLARVVGVPRAAAPSA